MGQLLRKEPSLSEVAEALRTLNNAQEVFTDRALKVSTGGEGTPEHLFVQQNSFAFDESDAFEAVLREVRAAAEVVNAAIVYSGGMTVALENGRWTIGA